MRFRSDGLKTMPETNPPASRRTFFQEYGTDGAALALGTFIVTRATAVAPAASATDSAPASFSRMCEVLSLGRAEPVPTERPEAARSVRFMLPQSHGGGGGPDRLGR